MYGEAMAIEETIWDTNWGLQKLWREGNLIKGEYIFDDGVLYGTLEGNIFRGWWREYNNRIECGPDNNWSGPVVFLFSDDWKSFSGDWGYCSSKPEDLDPYGSDWSGTLKENTTNYTETECLNASRYWCNGVCQIQPCGTDITQEQCETSGKVWCNGVCELVQCNTPPIANEQFVTTDENNTKNITLTGMDVDMDPLEFGIATEPTHGTLKGAAPNLTYTPDKDYNGADSFTFTVSDGKSISTPATVNITVKPNTVPIANPQSVTTDEDTATTITLIGTDGDSDPLTFAVAIQPAHGTLKGTAPNLIYTPSNDYFGSDSFTFKVNDGKADSSPEMVSITVKSVNDAPAVSFENSSAILIKLNGTDVDNDPLNYSVVTQPVNGTITGTAPNLIYTSKAGYTGADSFTVKANDGKIDSQVVTVNIDISGPGCGVIFDIGNDCKKGIEEAIDALKAVTGGQPD